MLRIELLYAAVMYGALSVLAEGDRDTEWLEYMEWVSQLISDIAEGTEAAVEHDSVSPEWLRHVLRALRTSDAEGFVEASGQDFQEWAQDEFERLALRVRSVEQDGAEPFREIEGERSYAGTRLLGLMQDSLVLASAPDQDTRDRRAAAREVLAHLKAARDEGVWEILTT